MANGFTKLHAQDAVRHRSKLDLSRQHLTTLNIAQIVPLFHEELCVGDSMNVRTNIFSRMQSLVVPTFGKLDLRTLSVFCPYYQCAKDFDAWYSGQTHFNGKLTVQRQISDNGIRTLFTHTTGTYAVSQACTGSMPSGWLDVTDADRSWYDFRVWDVANSAYIYYEFTTFGKYVYKVFRSLGYQIPSNLRTSYSSSTVPVTYYSAMPILAFFKVYNDLMSQATKVNTSHLSESLYCIKTGQNYSGAYGPLLAGTYASGTGLIDGELLLCWFAQLMLMYASDYFTSAWEMPNAIIAGNNTSSTIQNTVPYYYNSTAGTKTAMVNDDFTYINTLNASTGNTGDALNARSLKFLKAFDDFVRRNNYSGSRAVQNIYSRFGIKTEDYKSHFPDMITSDSMPMQVGDIMCNADTYDENAGTGMKVGEYAGKGIITGSNGFSYKSSENGMLFVLGWIAVKPIYADGIEKQCLRTSHMDYYQPEFDGLSGDVIPFAEVACNNKNWKSADGNTDNDVYGFTEKYNSYRFGHSQITGDYCTLSAMDSWHFGRDLSVVRSLGHMKAQDNSMVKIAPTSDEYNRIFAVTDAKEDCFYLTCVFNVDAYRPMGNLSDVADLGNGSIEMDRGGSTVE